MLTCPRNSAGTGEVWDQVSTQIFFFYFSSRETLDCSHLLVWSISAAVLHPQQGAASKAMGTGTVGPPGCLAPAAQLGGEQLA